ncbi:MAG TPA: SPOR domain-containing protein [Chryseolinea sp.]|nr:SPOR domain-containing protein [Chryseolinea sp.]
MRQLWSTFHICLLVVALAGCAAKKPVATSAPGTRYSEDLSIWRPKVEPPATGIKTTTPAEPDGRKPTTYVEPKYAVNKKLDPILDSIDRYNVQRNYIEGFTIQVYSGSKKDDALNAKKSLANTLPDLQSEVQYVQPNFRVKVGKYFNRIEAQKDFLDVKRLFPSAIVIPDKVSIN